MKKYLLILLVLVVFFSCEKKESTKTQVNTPTTDDQLNKAIEYDSVLAKEVGADDYGMRKYVLAYLKKGPNRDLSKEEASQLQSAHMKNIRRMAEMGKLIIAGPFMDDGDVRGIYIFAVNSMEEAKELTQSDPAIKAGSLAMELHPWYGPAALVLTQNLQKKLTKTKI